MIVKGGPDANLYDYGSGGVSSDTGLHAPVNKGRRYFALSQIVFCVARAQAARTTARETTTALRQRQDRDDNHSNTPAAATAVPGSASRDNGKGGGNGFGTATAATRTTATTTARTGRAVTPATGAAAR